MAAPAIVSNLKAVVSTTTSDSFGLESFGKARSEEPSKTNNRPPQEVLKTVLPKFNTALEAGQPLYKFQGMLAELGEALNNLPERKPGQHIDNQTADVAIALFDYCRRVDSGKPFQDAITALERRFLGDRNFDNLGAPTTSSPSMQLMLKNAAAGLLDQGQAPTAIEGASVNSALSSVAGPKVHPLQGKILAMQLDVLRPSVVSASSSTSPATVDSFDPIGQYLTVSEIKA